MREVVSLASWVQTSRRAHDTPPARAPSGSSSAMGRNADLAGLPCGFTLPWLDSCTGRAPLRSLLLGRYDMELVRTELLLEVEEVVLTVPRLPKAMWGLGSASCRAARVGGGCCLLGRASSLFAMVTFLGTAQLRPHRTQDTKATVGDSEYWGIKNR